MELVFLGTGSATPTFERNVAALACKREREVLLFDCGEGTQHQIIRSPLKRSRIRKILITHLHGDHFYGLIGLLTSFQLNKREEPLQIFGPPGIAEYVRFMKRISETDFNYPLKIHELTIGKEPQTILETTEYWLEAVRVRHRIYTLAYSLVEKLRPGRLNAALAAELGIPEGPERRLLKEGRDITLKDGRIISSGDLVTPPLPGRKIVYITDSTYTTASVDLARKADILIHESTYDNDDRKNARRTQHSTVSDAVQVAREAGVRDLILTHVSSRYLNRGNVIQEQLEQELPGAVLAADLMRVVIPASGRPEIIYRARNSSRPSRKNEKDMCAMRKPEQ
ncbi:MAG: ribonuclease Z [Candidatus Delongbacteria bacterium]|nr:ribonuclease Z [Candidatus Delongbacteria bacterium]